ncbi:MAG: hypothetical protein IJ467_07020 [Bacteroidaceae bacterium]|nr:hypothetical protein [Bacteroidaceae bacterium]
MKRYIKVFPALCLMGCVALASCSSEWDDHYDEAALRVDADGGVDISNSTLAEYIEKADNLNQMYALLNDNKVFDDMYAEGQYTVFVCPDDKFDESKISNDSLFALHSVANTPVSPAKLVDGSNINTRSGKSVWVYEGGKQLDGLNITKKVKAANGYIYYLDGILPVRPSAYELLVSLGDEYSRFKSLVLAYDYKFFDREQSRPIGVTEDGRVKYDSVIVVKNSLMDRYSEEGTPTWNMRSESYTTTMFIPSNALIENAMKAAMDSIPLWLNRQATAADTIKFEEWIVKACFSDKNRGIAEVNAAAPDFKAVEGYQEIVDEASDQTTYKKMDAVWWRPAVQVVDVNNPVELSNGMAYYCQEFKIPNHVVIYRVKSRLYELWNNMTLDQQAQYFRWENWVDPMIINDCQGQFDLIATGYNVQWPTIYYHNLCAIPSPQAMNDSLPCSVEYDGLVWNEQDQMIYECNLPAGEYFLRMGFKHSLQYSLSIAFNDKWLKEDMNMHATGSDYHFDRGAASPVPHYGEDYGIAYPEGFDVDYWQTQNEKAIAYDTDGYTVGVVTLAKSGNFRIRITSNDMSRIYKAQLDNGVILNRDKGNVNQLMMYHWCLRPTHNNY